MGEFTDPDAKESAVDMAESKELGDVAAGLGVPDPAAVVEDGEAGHGEAQEGLKLGCLPCVPSQQPVQFLSHLLLLSSPSEWPAAGCRGLVAVWEAKRPVAWRATSLPPLWFISGVTTSSGFPEGQGFLAVAKDEG